MSQAFRRLEQAEAFVKAKIKEELYNDHRPAHMRDTPVPLSLKTECNDGDEELADDVSRMRIQN
jgi:hypothetical protein